MTDDNRTLEFRPRRRRVTAGKVSEPTAMGDLMVPALAKLGLRVRARQAQLELLWPAVVGEAVAAETAVKGFARGRLTVATSSPALSHQLHLQRELIIEGLNQKAGEMVVKELHFRLAQASR